MTIDAGLKPEGAPERSPIAGAGAPSGVDAGPKRYSVHGSNYMSGDFQDEIQCLGIEASPSFVRQPEGNGVAERFIRTLKENVLWVRTFKTIEELRAELVAFARRYNETWLVARHGYKTPARVREEQTMPRIAKIVSMYARGMTVREIQGHLVI